VSITYSFLELEDLSFDKGLLVVDMNHPRQVEKLQKAIDHIIAKELKVTKECAKRKANSACPITSTLHKHVSKSQIGLLTVGSGYAFAPIMTFLRENGRSAFILSLLSSPSDG
jgi:hypothetical protein